MKKVIAKVADSNVDFSRLAFFSFILFSLVMLPLIVGIVVFKGGGRTPEAATITYTACSADVNKDGIVNVLDLSLVSKNLGPVTSTNLNYNINGDGNVNVIDLSLVAKFDGQSCPSNTEIYKLTFSGTHALAVGLSFSGPTPIDSTLKIAFVAFDESGTRVGYQRWNLPYTGAIDWTAPKSGKYTAVLVSTDDSGKILRRISNQASFMVNGYNLMLSGTHALDAGFGYLPQDSNPYIGLAVKDSNGQAVGLVKGLIGGVVNWTAPKPGVYTAYISTLDGQGKPLEKVSNEASFTINGYNLMLSGTHALDAGFGYLPQDSNRYIGLAVKDSNGQAVGLVKGLIGGVVNWTGQSGGSYSAVIVTLGNGVVKDEVSNTVSFSLNSN